MTHEIVTVDFYGDTLFAAQEDERVLIAVKPITQRLGLNWDGQRQRIRRDGVLSQGAVMITVPSAGGAQEMICLPLDLVPGFLFGIDDRRIRDAARREVVLRYKRECHRVLYEHFFGGASAAPEIDDPGPIAAPAPPASEWWLWLQVIREARLTAGDEAAKGIWLQSPLPRWDGDEALAALGSGDERRRAIERLRKRRWRQQHRESLH
jgi:hypothetical protein